MRKVDPVCAFHGKKMSEHKCLYCCICFANLTPSKCYVDSNRVKWDMCKECGEREEAYHPTTEGKERR